MNKLLIDLNAAKKEVIKAQAANQQERMQLAEKVISLENELQVTQLELEKTQLEFERTKESVATREFEFASTIKKLEEDAQLAQQALSKASLGNSQQFPSLMRWKKVWLIQKLGWKYSPIVFKQSRPMQPR